MSVSRVAALLLLLVARAGTAFAFPLMSISELGAGFLGDPNVQFVELRFDASGTTDLTNTRLTVFDKDGVANVLLLTPSDVANGTAGRTVLYATSAFQTATGVVPDYVIPVGVVGPSGMVCWGAPATTPPDPTSWDADKPENYVDCVAYGGYAHATRAASGTPTTLHPGDGVQSLTRVKNGSAAGSNDADFALAAATPCNDAGACADLATTPTPTATPTAAGTPTATATPGKAVLACRRAVIKVATKFSAAYVDARSACETRRLKGKTAACPDATATTKIATADAKRSAAIAKACGGLAPAAAGFPAACPGHTGGCTNAIADVAGVSTCLDCGVRATAEELLTFAYASAPDPALTTCQLGFGKAIASHYRGVAALLARCEDAAARGKIAGTCPDAKTAARVAAREAKLRTTLCRACGGSDKKCGGAPDVAPAALAITSCPTRTVPGGSACGAIAITGPSDLVSCVQCYTAFENACASHLAARPSTQPADCTAP